LNSIGRAVIDLSGEPLHKASLLKLIGNIFIVAMIETTAEGHVLAEKTGLGHGPLQTMIQAIFPGPAAFYSDRMVTGKYYKEPVSKIYHLTPI
jgi:3-hydroxyisobutyrate dehydrogenase-like beta-hydroxyacid dehydrogenase